VTRRLNQCSDMTIRSGAGDAKLAITRLQLVAGSRQLRRDPRASSVTFAQSHLDVSSAPPLLPFPKKQFRESLQARAYCAHQARESVSATRASSLINSASMTDKYRPPISSENQLLIREKKVSKDFSKFWSPQRTVTDKENAISLSVIASSFCGGRRPRGRVAGGKPSS
jgi:hypothetical protein